MSRASKGEVLQVGREQPMALARLDIARMVRPVLPVLAGVVFLELAIGALGPVAAVQLVERGASASLVGLVSSSYYAGFLLSLIHI